MQTGSATCLGPESALKDAPQMLHRKGRSVKLARVRWLLLLVVSPKNVVCSASQQSSHSTSPSPSQSGQLRYAAPSHSSHSTWASSSHELQ